MDAAVGKYSTMTQKLAVLKELYDGDLSARTSETGGWAEQVLRTVASNASNVSDDDGVALAEIALSLKDEISLKDM